MAEILTSCRFCKSTDLDIINQYNDLAQTGIGLFLNALQSDQKIGSLYYKLTFGFIFCNKCGRINQKLTEADVKEYREKIEKSKTNGQ